MTWGTLPEGFYCERATGSVLINSRFLLWWRNELYSSSRSKKTIFIFISNFELELCQTCFCFHHFHHFPFKYIWIKFHFSLLFDSFLCYICVQIVHWSLCFCVAPLSSLCGTTGNLLKYLINNINSIECWNLNPDTNRQTFSPQLSLFVTLLRWRWNMWTWAVVYCSLPVTNTVWHLLVFVQAAGRFSHCG